MIPLFYVSRATLGVALALVCMTALPACGSDSPRRIVSISAPITEILFALGAGDRVVAVDTTSRFPEQAASLPDVGYMRALSAEGILSVSPDLVMAPASAGPPEVLSQLQKAGVQVEIMADPVTLDGLSGKILEIARLTNREQAGKALVQDLTGIMDRAQPISGPDAPGVLFLLSVSSGLPIVAGHNTVADYLIRQAGARNVADHVEGFKPLSGESATMMAPDILLLGSHALGPDRNTDSVTQLPQIASTPAAINKRIVVVDSTLLLGLGPRTPQAVANLARSFGTAEPRSWNAH